MYLTLVFYAEHLTNGSQWKVVDAVTETFLTGPVFLFKVNVEIGVPAYTVVVRAVLSRGLWPILKPYSS
jgi:hypothetical protein